MMLFECKVEPVGEFLPVRVRVRVQVQCGVPDAKMRAILHASWSLQDCMCLLLIVCKVESFVGYVYVGVVDHHGHE